MCCQPRPVSAAYQQEMFRAGHRFRQRRRDSRTVAALRKNLDPVLIRALAQQPDKRHASVRHLAADVVTAVESLDAGDSGLALASGRTP